MIDSEEFSIHRIKGSLSSSDDIVLEETPDTCLVFRPKIHDGGVNGEIIRFKIVRGKKVEPERVDFRKLKLDEGMFVSLSTKSVSKLVKRVHELYLANKQLSPWNIEEGFTVAKVDTVIDDTNKLKYIKQLLSSGYSDEFWKELVKADPDLATRLSWAKIYENYDIAIEEFRTSMISKADDESYWQAFFEKNVWIMQMAFSYPVIYLEGDVYIGGKKARKRQGTGGVATDFLFKNGTTSSFGVIEIKTPDTDLVGSIYRGKKEEGGSNEVYAMSGKLSGSTVQTQTQISVAKEQFTSVLNNSFDNINPTHPQAILIIGRQDKLSPEQKTSFNHFRYGYRDVTIITFDELLAIISNLISQQETESGEPDVDETSVDVWL